MTEEQFIAHARCLPSREWQRLAARIYHFHQGHQVADVYQIPEITLCPEAWSRIAAEVKRLKRNAYMRSWYSSNPAKVEAHQKYMRDYMTVYRKRYANDEAKQQALREYRREYWSTRQSKPTI